MAELTEYVNVLAEQIGPRPVSTEEEHQASLYIAQELTERGLDVSVDEFATPTGVRWPYVLAFILVSIGTFISGIGTFVPGISLSMFLIGLLLVGGGFFVYYTEHNNQPFLSKMRMGGVSQNVIAKYVPSSVARESRRRKIIIAAHVDTVRSRPEAAPAIIAHAPLLHKITFYCMIGLVASLLIRLLPLPWPEVIDTVLWVISLIACVYVLAAAACIIASNFTPYVPGGNDNASSIAVLLSVARRLLDPEERKRYSMERARQEEAEIPVETFATDATGPINIPTDLIEEPSFVMHSAEEALDAGLVPEGVEVIYDDDAERADATVVLPALSPEEQLGVLADTAAEELHIDSVATSEFSLDDFGQPMRQTGSMGAIPEIKVPDLDFTLDEDVESSQKEPAERLDDAVIFADYLAAEEQEVQPAAEEIPPMHKAPEDEPIELEAVEVIDEEPPAPAPVYVPIETPSYPRNKRQQVARPVPSWYAAAKEKAARDLEKRAEEPASQQPATGSYRSRFADTPAAVENERSIKGIDPELELLKEKEEKIEAIEAEIDALEQVEAIEEVVENKDQIAIDLDIPDDQLDELSPDTSGMFARIEIDEVTVEAKKIEAAPKELTSRIPNIGSSDDKVREVRKNAAEERAARPLRTDLQDIPVVEGDMDDSQSIPVHIEALAPGEEMKVDVAPGEVTGSFVTIEEDVAKPTEVTGTIPALPKQARKKPTARHITDSFTPTRAVDADHPLGDKRQEAPVASAYEDTPQAAPAHDAFAPKEEPYRAERQAPVARVHRERSSSELHVSTPRGQVDAQEISASSTTSFPSLTGSFPALTGSMPVVDAEDFSASSVGPIADDDALDNFMAGGQTTEINMPESRFRNAVDKVGGLFNRKKDGEDDSVDSGWEEDDYGWKGGGYFEEETEMAYDAVRQRAAQIRESVVSMTERDLLDKEVWFVALGASSADNQGMKNFLDLHASELRGSLIINLEGIGAGKISYIDLEGTGRPQRGDRRLMNLVKKASKTLKGIEMKPKSLLWRNTDATPAMMAGMRALTIMGFAENGVAPVNWHRADDTADIVEEDNLEYMTSLLLNVIENS